VQCIEQTPQFFIAALDIADGVDHDFILQGTGDRGQGVKHWMQYVTCSLSPVLMQYSRTERLNGGISASNVHSRRRRPI